MAGRPAKSLSAHCVDRTFRPSRHGHLLATEPLSPGLADFSARYRAAVSDRERQAVALELRDAIDAGQGQRELSAAEFFYAGLGPGLADWDDLGFRQANGSIDWAGYHKLERRWRHWNGRHGVWWRIRHNATHNSDAIRLYKLVTGGKTTKRVDEAELKLRDHQPLLDTLAAEHEPCPDPPGLELLPHRVRAYSELVGSVEGGAMDAAISSRRRSS
jgi:hypothetical protein